MDSFEIVSFFNFNNKDNNRLIQSSVVNNDDYVLYQDYNMDIYNINKTNEMNYENIITLDLDKFIIDLEKTFTGIYDIQNQFKLDIERSFMTFNGHIIQNPNTIMNYLDYLYRIKNPKLEKEYLILSTQAVFAIPFCIIQKSVEHMNLFLSEITSNDYQLSKYSKKYKIDIVDDKLILEKYMRLFSLTEKMDSLTEYIVKINIHINLIKDRSFLLTYNFISL